MMNADQKAFLNSVVNSIKQDNAKDAFLSADEETRIKIAQAYAIHAVKKFDEFATRYKTNEAARQAFNETILNSI